MNYPDADCRCKYHGDIAQYSMRELKLAEVAEEIGGESQQNADTTTDDCGIKQMLMFQNGTL